MKQICLWLFLGIVFLCAKGNYTNALIDESSPYLQQHAHNPVNWYPWGKEALKRAKREQKLIFLSIGYSTCHWCHVMEEESFTDKSVAKLLNVHFISIKVDKEEYPQLDKKYQQVYKKLHGKRGGWPLSVFLSPDGEVLDIRTYIPKEEGYGSEGLLNLLPQLSALLHDPHALQQHIEKNNRQLLGTQKIQSEAPRYGKHIAERIFSAIASQYDSRYGGFAVRPKFPEASKIALLLTRYRLIGDISALKMVTHTLTQMAHRGIYDQISGGFFRYATDAAWQQPHFEKMLYTNAQMIPVYVDAYLLTGDPLYKRVVKETIAAMETYYTRHGLFVSASDADSSGEEGGYYIFSYEDVRSDLFSKGWEPKALEAALAYWGIEEDGNIDGELSLPHVAASTKPPEADALRRYLRQRQAQRRFPFVDTKIITSWNAMMIKALFDASKIEPAYAEDAVAYLDRLWRLMYRNGKLYHQTLAGKVPKQEGMLEDYSYLIGAFISGYERTYDTCYLKCAAQLAKEAGTKFYKEGKWYLSDDGVEALADFDDKYYTAPLSVLWNGMLSLAALQEDIGLYTGIKKQIVQAVFTLTERDVVTASKLLYAYLRVQYGDVIIHASKKRLQDGQKVTDHIRYPFILSGAQASDAYVACRVNSCFAIDENITRLIGKIEALSHQVQKKGAKRWQK